MPALGQQVLLYAIPNGTVPSPISRHDRRKLQISWISYWGAGHQLLGLSEV